MTFSQWLSEQEWRDDPVGDLALDMRRDKKWRDPQSLESLMFHVGPIASDAAAQAWAEWQST